MNYFCNVYNLLNLVKESTRFKNPNNYGGRELPKRYFLIRKVSIPKILFPIQKSCFQNKSLVSNLKISSPI